MNDINDYQILINNENTTYNNEVYNIKSGNGSYKDFTDKEKVSELRIARYEHEIRLEKARYEHDINLIKNGDGIYSKYDFAQKSQEIVSIRKQIDNCNNLLKELAINQRSNYIILLCYYYFIIIYNKFK